MRLVIRKKVTLKDGEVKVAYKNLSYKIFYADIFIFGKEEIILSRHLDNLDVSISFTLPTSVTVKESFKYGRHKGTGKFYSRTVINTNL